MKKRLSYIAIMVLFLLSAGLAQAAVYTIDFNPASYTSNAAGDFTIDPIPGIEAASLDIVIKGRTTYTNNHGYSWYYESIIDLIAGGAQLLDNHHLGGDFTTLHFDLSTEVVALLETTQALSFNIQAQGGFWDNDFGSSGYSTTRFYLDEVSLTVTPSAVPIPPAAFMFTPALLGLLGLRRKLRV
jgi:hypothetical protein